MHRTVAAAYVGGDGWKDCSIEGRRDSLGRISSVKARTVGRNGYAMMRTDWKQIIFDLMSAGLSGVKIAERVGCSQSTINGLKNGYTDQPWHDTGEAILRLHEQYKSAMGKKPVPKLAEIRKKPTARRIGVDLT